VTSRRALAPLARTTADEVKALERWLNEAIDAGLDLIQIRERDLPARDLASLVERAVAAAAGGATAIVVNDRVDVALATGASGVHLPGDGPAGARVRAVCGPGGLIGRSVHAPEEATTEAQALDYLLFGTVFETDSKPAGRRVAGLEALRATAAAVDRLVLAIGGVTPERVGACQRAGAGGVAGIGVFLPPGRARGSLGVRAAARALRAAWVLE
jgi:thiamine-phosphate pyrophosphorylase